MNFNEAYNKMIDENASLSFKNTEDDLSNFSFLGSWANHYKSWKNNFEFKTKTETALNAIENGVRAVVILDGRAPNACLLELFTEHGAGSLIRKN